MMFKECEILQTCVKRKVWKSERKVYLVPNYGRTCHLLKADN